LPVKAQKKHFSKAEQDNCPMITIKHSSVVGVVLAAVAATSAAHTDDQRPVINTLREVYSALRACWSPPPLAELRGRLELSVRLSFRGNGEILGEPFITFETPNVSEEERLAYRIPSRGRCKIAHHYASATDWEAPLQGVRLT
jgi:hypothetical protein